MPHDVKINQNDKIVILHWHGDVSFADAVDAMHEAKGILGETGFNKLLIDAQAVKSTMNTLEVFEFFSSKLPRHTKIAILLSHSKKIAADINFGVTTALNRGFWIRSSRTKKDTSDWLLS